MYLCLMHLPLIFKAKRSLSLTSSPSHKAYNLKKSAVFVRLQHLLKRTT